MSNKIAICPVGAALIHVEALRVPGDKAPRFPDNRHIKVARLSALHTVHLYPQEIFLVLISVTG
jgi:hypothetical protein